MQKHMSMKPNDGSGREWSLGCVLNIVFFMLEELEAFDVGLVYGFLFLFGEDLSFFCCFLLGWPLLLFLVAALFDALLLTIFFSFFFSFLGWTD